MFSHTSGRSIFGFNTEPRSPPVQVATATRTPSATYLAVVAAPLDDSSSGWACTWRSRNRSPSAACAEKGTHMTQSSPIAEGVDATVGRSRGQVAGG